MADRGARNVGYQLIGSVANRVELVVDGPVRLADFDQAVGEVVVVSGGFLGTAVGFLLLDAIAVEIVAIAVGGQGIARLGVGDGSNAATRDVIEYGRTLAGGAYV